MWMMGCNDGGGFNMSTDTFNGRKLRPLIPRPSSSSSVTTPTPTVTTHPTPTTYSNITSTTITTTTNNSSNNISTSHHHYHPHVPPPPPPPPQPSCFRNLHHTDIFLLNNHLSMVTEQNKRDLQIGGSGATTTTTTTTTVVNSRWNPTPEQLRTLEELYRRGTRTPSADQIQHITAQLRRYGKIEGKNVFYWFQNHKARERQKRRRRSEYIDLEERQQQQQQQFEIDLHQRNESGSSRTVYEVQQTKNWSLPTNCSTTNTTLSQGPVSMQEAAVGAVESGMKTDGWIELEDRELQHNNNNNRGPPPTPIDIHDTWQMMNLSCSSSPHPNLNIFISSPPPPQYKERFYHQDKFDHQKSHTLELFPLRNIENNNDEKINGGDHHHHRLMIRKEITTHELLPVTTMNNNTTTTTTTNFNTAPCKFFEFL